jgi:hypothetical protein
MAEVSSAIEAATGMTNRQGISQPKTMPTCPPETRPKIIVEETEAMTPMIEKEKAMVSMS